MLDFNEDVSQGKHIQEVIEIDTGSSFGIHRTSGITHYQDLATHVRGDTSHKENAKWVFDKMISILKIGIKAIAHDYASIFN